MLHRQLTPTFANTIDNELFKVVKFILIIIFFYFSHQHLIKNQPSLKMRCVVKRIERKCRLYGDATIISSYTNFGNLA